MRSRRQTRKPRSIKARSNIPPQFTGVLAVGMGLAIMPTILLLGVAARGNFGTSRAWLWINRWLLGPLGDRRALSWMRRGVIASLWCQRRRLCRLSP
jgi:hypothetical protein